MSLKRDKFWDIDVEDWANIKGIAIKEPKNYMTTRDFCYWLQGFIELNKPEAFTAEQTIEIRKHLYAVFQHDCENIGYSEVTKEFYVKDPPSYGYGANTPSLELNVEDTKEPLVCDGAPKRHHDSFNLQPAFGVVRYANPPVSC